MYVTLLFFYVTLLFFLSIKKLQAIKVKVGTVTYIGSNLESWNSDPIFAFRGIRFVQSPIGNLRFKDPKPLVYDVTVPVEYDATRNGNDCPSIYAENPSEDCLFLNVYTRNIPTNSNLTVLKPIIAFLHPGGFYIGSSSSSFYGPEYLLTNDIVLVTFNYRLGILGFLNLGTEEIPGNAGLKDQVIALRWIRDNISVFGGNPRDVTLMGYSAGAFSVCLHLVSPMSRGLFHRAIIMSGSIPPQKKLPYEQKHLAMKQAKLLGCKNVLSSKEIIECLNKFNGNEIAAKLRSMFIFGKDNPIFLWLPILEQDFGQEKFLTEVPYKSFQEGNFNKVPILIGFTSNELCTSAADILKNPHLQQTFNSNFTKLAPICFMYDDYQNTEFITSNLKQKYFTSDSIKMENFPELCNIFSDSLIRFGSHRIAEIVSRYVPVFTYKFTYVGKHTNLIFSNGPKGAEHMDDLMYLFPSRTFKFNHNDSEAAIIITMIDFISNFINKREIFQLDSNQKWDYQSSTYIEIKDETLQKQNGRNFERINIWNEIFPITSY